MIRSPSQCPAGGRSATTGPGEHRSSSSRSADAGCEATSSPGASAAFAGHRRPGRCSRCTAAYPPRRGTSPEVRGRSARDSTSLPEALKTTLARQRSLTTRRSRGRACREVAIRCAMCGRYRCCSSVLRRSSRLIVDTARPSSAAVAVKRAAIPVQIGDHDPLLQREVPHRRRPGLSSQGLHSEIVQPLAGPVDDRSPVPAARPGTPVHADDPTGLRVAHPLPDQTYELLTLPRKNIPPMMPIASLHHVHRTPRSISALRRSLESAHHGGASASHHSEPWANTALRASRVPSVGVRSSRRSGP